MLSCSRWCRPMAEHLRRQSMLATPEPGRSGSNPYGRPRIFRPLRRFGRQILSTRPSAAAFADVTGDQFAVWQCAGEADQYKRSVSHVDGPVAKRSNYHLDHLCVGARTLRGGTPLRRQIQGLERDRAPGWKWRRSLYKGAAATPLVNHAQALVRERPVQ